ncbi:N-acetylmuramoyl-L-alanine amidase [Anoxybacterium hadale]|uniref:N-acetylmuramoyl-L-alanine amidase n=1 Tax=Anoxybacterium hadale TaxID=3408580 RepID=A0ACD1A799_9FIRM|nr:N-acetylmuramoyl-L-alanine amidase [Clostridiales bacterium]
MVKVFLNPSNQDYNDYVGGGNEEEYMNLIVDAMIPYLRASGIQFERSSPWESLTEVIERTNEEPFDYVLSLQSASAPPDLAEMLRGPEVYFYAFSHRGRAAAQLVESNLKAIYPQPNLVSSIPNKTSRILRDAPRPSVLVNVGYHDNATDAQWIRENIDTIARQLVLSISEYLGTPFVDIGETDLFGRRSLNKMGVL